MLSVLFWRPMIPGVKGNKCRNRNGDGRWLTWRRAVVQELVEMSVIRSSLSCSLNSPAEHLSTSTLLKGVSEFKNAIVGCENGNFSGLKSLDKLCSVSCSQVLELLDLHDNLFRRLADGRHLLEDGLVVVVLQFEPETTGGNVVGSGGDIVSIGLDMVTPADSSDKALLVEDIGDGEVHFGIGDGDPAETGSESILDASTEIVMARHGRC